MISSGILVFEKVRGTLIQLIANIVHTFPEKSECA